MCPVFQCPGTVERTRQIVSGSSNVDPFFSVECLHAVRSAVPAPRLRSAVSSCARCPASSVPVFCFFCAGVLLLTLEMLTRESLSGPSCLMSPVLRFRCYFTAVNRFGRRAHPPVDTVPVLTPEVIGLGATSGSVEPLPVSRQRRIDVYRAFARYRQRGPGNP